jgi:hypothetical protein
MKKRFEKTASLLTPCQISSSFDTWADTDISEIENLTERRH